MKIIDIETFMKSIGSTDLSDLGDIDRTICGHMYDDQIREISEDLDIDLKILRKARKRCRKKELKVCGHIHVMGAISLKHDVIVICPDFLIDFQDGGTEVVH